MNISKTSRTTSLPILGLNIDIACADSYRLQKSYLHNNSANIIGVSSAKICTLTHGVRITRLFDRCNEVLKTMSLVKNSANHGSDTVLLPAISNTLHPTPGAIQAYSVCVLDRTPTDIIRKSHFIYIPKLEANNKVYDVGIYTFVLTKQQVKCKMPKHATRLFINLKMVNGRHHYSPATPEETGIHPH